VILPGNVPGPIDAPDPGDAFGNVIPRLRSARMGTELMGPLLYSLARSVRAERVVEVGAGMTTLYLLRALADNRADVARERLALPAKQRLYDPSWTGDEDAGRRAEHAVLTWLEADPPLVDPDYYGAAYEPRCVTIDDASSPFSMAGQVVAAAREAGLGDLLERLAGDFRAAPARFRSDGVRFDLAWFDCGGYREYRDFLDLYWDLIEPDGGMIVLHYTLTVPNHERVLAELAAARRTGQRGQFEMLSLLEPHKLMQNSCTLIRRCERPPRRFPLTRAISLERSGQ
jgi:predicted O-methyltransferase YrrM